MEKHIPIMAIHFNGNTFSFIKGCKNTFLLRKHFYNGIAHFDNENTFLSKNTHPDNAYT